MTPDQLRAACKTLTSGNIREFCRDVGIGEATYYRAIKSGRVSELTAFRVKRVMEGKSDE